MARHGKDNDHTKSGQLRRRGHFPDPKCDDLSSSGPVLPGQFDHKKQIKAPRKKIEEK